MAGLYHYVPNTQVNWRHAWAGGFFVAVCMELAKKGLALYVAKVPTYSAVYGTFATLPILLVWIYVAWVIVLLGAVVAAYLPSLLAGSSRSLHEPGWELELALEAIAVLEPLRSQDQRGLPAMALAKRLRVDRLQLEPALSALASIRWVGAMPESGTAYLEEGEPRYVLLADPDQTLLAPLLQHMLIRHTEGTDALWRSAGWEHRLLRDALPSSHGPCKDPVAQAGATSPAAVH